MVAMPNPHKTSTGSIEVFENTASERRWQVVPLLDAV